MSSVGARAYGIESSDSAAAALAAARSAISSLERAADVIANTESREVALAFSLAVGFITAEVQHRIIEPIQNTRPRVTD